MEKIKVKYKKVSELTPYARNSRTHSDVQVQQIANSIAEFGFTNPILIDHMGEIIAGHGRVLAALRLGLSDVPCITLGHLSDRQKRAYVIADNKLALNAGWDFNILADEVSRLSEEDYDLDVMGFDEQELEAILKNDAGILPADFSEPEQIHVSAHTRSVKPGIVDDEYVPDVVEKPVSKIGDVWILGDHRLMCGDSTDLESVRKLMNGLKADILITDPPYNVNYEGKTKEALTIQNDSMEDSDFRNFLRLAYKAADDVMRPGAVFYIWHADSEGYNFRGAAHDVGWKVRQCLIWKKQTMVMGRQDYHWKHEPCLYGWKDGAGHTWASDRKQTTILEFDRPFRNDIHPTMKPVDLFSYQIENNTYPKNKVLDLFGGGGTTVICCEKTDRLGFVMELDPKYVDVIINRWQAFTGQEAVLESTGKTYSETLALI